MLIFLLFFLHYSISSEIYDEDINLVFPSEELPHSANDVPALKFIGIYNNCICNESPDTLLVECFGENCEIFPIFPFFALLFKLKLSGIVKISLNDLVYLENIEALEIEGNKKLEIIEPGCFRNMSQLRNLTISNNIMLNYLQENVFDGLRSLEILCISKNGFRKAINVAISLSPVYLPNLKLLDLSQNILHSIRENDFVHMNGTSLQTLNIHLCGLGYIHPNSLNIFKKLSVLRLGQNMLNTTVITQLVFSILKSNIPLNLLNMLSNGFMKYPPFELLTYVAKSKISDLILAQNYFNQIDDTSFPSMPHLFTLDLRECDIEFVSNRAFAKLIHLKSLLINRNRLNTVPLGVVVPSLLILDIAGNLEQAYFFIPDNIFENMSVLLNLQLSYNNIQYISKKTFVGLKNLRILNLKNTQLSYIEDGAFIHTPKLLHLNLIKNPLLFLMPITADTFQGLVNLHVLLLGYCGITNLTSPMGLFHHMKNITYLGLDNNEIHTIKSNQLTHLNNLQKLHLENNKLTLWFECILPKHDFKEIVLSQNKFISLTFSMLYDIRTAKILNLDDNPFRCDCSLYSIAEWFMKNNSMKFFYAESKYFVAKCDTPEYWRKVSIVIFVSHLVKNPLECKPIYYKQVLFIIILLLIIIIIIFLYYCQEYIRYWIFLCKLFFIRHNLWTLSKKTTEYKYDVFISYAAEDSQWVTDLCGKLEPDLKLCIYERDFTPGATISSAIFQAVVTSRRTMLVLSEAFAKSHWCRWETELAHYHQIFFSQDSKNRPDDTLVLVRLQPVLKHATPILRYLMKTRVYLNWTQDGQQEFWNKLKNALSASSGEIYCIS